MPMELSVADGTGKRKALMKLPDICHIVTNGCETESGSRYHIDRENNVYIYLDELDVAVESEHTFACNDNGEQIPFSASNAKRIAVITMEEAVEKLASVE